MRVSMKYWAEHLGAPYQAAIQNPAYSYADFLHKERAFPISYQVWTLGSHRHFIWGDPEYARTFSQSLQLGDGDGFEICPQLAQKGYGNEPGAWRILNPRHEYYRWEWERYWMTHLLFGRLTYNRDANEEVWLRHFRAHFASSAELVLEGLRPASRIVSFVIRFNMSDPNMYIWPEADTGGLCEFYLAVEPSDPARIKSFREAAQEHLQGRFTARMKPAEAAAYLIGLGEECLRAAGELGNAAETGGELASAAVDISALGELAMYHAEKISAVEHFSYYDALGDYGSLVAASSRLAEATPHWERLAGITDGVYTDRQVTGPIDSGHWKDKLRLVREDERRLHELIELHKAYGGAEKAFDFGGSPDPGHKYLRVKALSRFYIEQKFTGVDCDCRWDRQSEYGWMGDGEINSVCAPAVRLCDWHLDTVFRDTMIPTGWEQLKPHVNSLYSDYVWGTVPATFVTSLPAGVYEVIIILGDRSEEARNHGPFDIRVNGDPAFSNVMSVAGEVMNLKKTFDLSQGRLTVTFQPHEGEEWFVSGIVARSEVPVITHNPPRTAHAGAEVYLDAGVSSPADIKGVTLCYRKNGNVMRDIMEPLEDNLLYRAPAPALAVQKAGKLDYWFEALSENGRRARLPAHTDSQRCYSLSVGPADQKLPSIQHEPVTAAKAGKDIDVTAKVHSTCPLQSVRLHYRHLNQYYQWNIVEMESDGSVYRFDIPGDYITANWDLMYYLEVVDERGEGSFAPESDPVSTIPYWVIRTAK